MKKSIFLFLSNVLATSTFADILPVNEIQVSVPYTISETILIDSVNVDGKKTDAEDVLMNSINTQAWKKGQKATPIVDDKGTNSFELKAKDAPTLYLTGFTFDNSHYAKCKIEATSSQKNVVYIDNKQGNEQNLMPGRHEVVIKVLCKANMTDTLKVNVISDQSKYITVCTSGKRPYTLADYMNGEKASTTSLSSNGRFLMLNTYTVGTDTKQTWKRNIIDLKTGVTREVNDFKSWATEGDKYIAWRKGIYGETIYEYVDLLTQKRELLFTNYSANNGDFLRHEKEMLINKSVEGPKDDAQVHQILEPDDRQPGWRNRNSLQLINVENGQLTQLTSGFHNTYASFSSDNSKVLITSTEDCLTEWPFSFRNIFLYNRDTHQLDTLVNHSGFINNATFTPDGQSVVFSGSPEAFNGIGKNDPTGKISSLIQTELFLMDLNTKQVKSLTYDFNPNIKSFDISNIDGCIYALCENRDRQDIFQINPKSGKTRQLQLSECYIKSFSLADNKAILSYTGQSDSNADRVYVVDLKSGKESLVRDFDAIRMKDIELGSCQDWNFTNSRGDTIYGRYYLPAHFDSSKQYPMLVYYYGGCSPTGRYLESYYNFHGWAAMGYVVYVVQPSGCTGFGQEFAARHVNTYGEGTAEDIIEGTKQFCKEHPYVNKDKIGCLGASYGGFMTQYLMTKTDIFAASMSHAGISNPTSYWGYGYWGYSYSAISAAHSYPWNNEKLLSGQAPLFNADKVHTPILFLHGASDTNVPINESIQMFTALKILGRECAFVTVEGQDHHILDYEKQIKWVSTYYAWFAKWLQDDPTWWNTLYPPKNL